MTASWLTDEQMAGLTGTSPCEVFAHDERRLSWDRERKGWPTECRVCGAKGFTQDPTIARSGAVG